MISIGPMSPIRHTVAAPGHRSKARGDIGALMIHQSYLLYI
jgi:hypothetical protein